MVGLVLTRKYMRAMSLAPFISRPVNVNVSGFAVVVPGIPVTTVGAKFDWARIICPAITKRVKTLRTLTSLRTYIRRAKTRMVPIETIF